MTVHGELAEIHERLARLEKLAHEPFDFTDLLSRVHELEQTVKRLTKRLRHLSDGLEP